MAIHVIQIGRQKFACGLFWQSLSRPRELAKEAAELAKKIRVDLMVLRRDHGTVQAGYANTSDGLRPGMLSLAAAVSQSIEQDGAKVDGKLQKPSSWLGAFRLPDDHWAYIAVREESFLPNGDFAGTREQVFERLRKDYALGGWNLVIGEAELQELGFPNFHARTIAQCLPRGRGGAIKAQRWWALRPVERHVPWGAVAMAALAASVVAGGAAWWLQYRGGQERRLPMAAASRPMVPAPHPWRSQPLPVDMAASCMRALTDVAPAGWRLDNHHCTTEQANDVWVRGDSTVGRLLEVVPRADVELNGEKARRSVHLPVDAARRDEPLEPARELLASSASALQQLGLAGAFTKVPPPPAPPPAKVGASGPPRTAPPDWQTYRFKVNTRGVPPDEVATALDKPGVRLEKLTYAGDSWLIEGVIYAK